MCQVCTVAIIGGLGLSRWLKVDDTISGVWIGALLVTIIYYTFVFYSNRSWNNFWLRFLTAIFYYTATVIPLYWWDVIGHPSNQLIGVDKFVIGLLAGGIVFIAAISLYAWMKKKNNGHAHFPMEKVVVPIVSLLILSGVFYLITK